MPTATHYTRVYITKNDQGKFRGGKYGVDRRLTAFPVHLHVAMGAPFSRPPRGKSTKGNLREEI